MALRGQILELLNEGRYQFILRVGILDDALPGRPRLFQPEAEEDESLSPEQEVEVYECRLDFTNPEKPLSCPLERLSLPMEIFDRYESPDGLTPVRARLWKIGSIVDTVITDIFSTDLLEIVRGDELPAPEPDGKDGPPIVEKTDRSPIRCPDCGTEYRTAVRTGKGSKPSHTCDSCGRLFGA